MVIASSIGIYRLVAKYKHHVKPIPINEFTYYVNKRDTTSRDYLLLSPYMVNRWWHGRILIMDMVGNIVYQKYVHGSAYDFQKWVINGKTRYSYFVNDVKSMHSKDLLMAVGSYVLLDSTLHEIKKIGYVPLADTEKAGKQGLDMHDLILFDDDHYITMCYRYTVVNNIPDSLKPKKNIVIAEPCLEEVDHGKVVWRWEGAKYPELYGTSVEHGDYQNTGKIQDYIHLNSAVLDPYDSSLICSFRNSNQVLKISRKDGHIVWRFGSNNSDFSLTSEQVFLRQHDVHYIPGTNRLIMLDNGDSLTRPYSRVLEFKLDEKRLKIDSFSAYKIPEGFAQFMGSVDKNNDHYLICGGTGNYLLDINPATGQKYFEIHSNLSSYRVYRISGFPMPDNQLNK